MSDKTKKGWLHHPEKESICLNIGSKEYESALDNGYVKNLTDMKEIEPTESNNEDLTDEDLLKDADSILTEIEARGLNFLEEIKKFEFGEKYLNPCRKEEEKIKELEASLKDSAKKIKELEASLKKKK